MALSDDLKNLEDKFKKLSELGNEFKLDMNDVAKAVRAVAQGGGDSAGAFRSIASDLSKSTNLANDLKEAGKETLKDSKAAVKLEQKLNDVKGAQRDIQGKINVLLARKVNANKKEAAQIELVVEHLKNSKDFLGSLISGYENLLHTSKELNQSNPFRGLSELVSEVPILNKLLSNMVTAADEYNKVFIDTEDRSKALFAGAKEYVKLLSKAAQVFLISTFIKGIKTIDESSVNLANQLNISKQEAGQLQIEFAKSAQENKSLLQTSQDLIDAQVKLGNALGTTAMISKDIASTFDIIVNRFGVSEQAASSLVEFTAATGMNFKEFTETAMGTAKVLGAQEGFLINSRDLIEDISKTSSSTLLSMRAQGISLEKAAFQARRLGLNLQSMEGIQESLLDFESSIQNELAAELLIGQNINLEKARLAALNDDLLGLGQALAEQDITQAKFANMNRIQKQAIAKTLGMSAKDMANMFIKEQAIRKLSAKDETDAVKKLQERISKGEDINKLIKETGSSELVNRAQNLSMQQKMNKIIQQLADTIMPVLVKVFEKIDSLLNSAGGYATEIGVALGALAIGGPIYRGISLYSRLFGGMAKDAGKIGTSLTSSVVGNTVPGGGINPSTMYSSPIGPVMSSKASKLGRVAKGLKATGRLAAPLALLGTGMDAYSNFTDESLSGGDAALKTIDQNKFLALGATIGSIVPGIGTLVGAGIGGLIDMFVPTIGEYGDKVENAINQQTLNLQQQNQIPPRIVLDGAALNQEGISTLRSNRFIQ